MMQKLSLLKENFFYNSDIISCICLQQGLAGAIKNQWQLPLETQ